MTLIAPAGPQLDARLARVQRLALLVGIGGAILAALGCYSNSRQFFFTYLASYMLFVGLTLGSIGVVCLHHLVGGRWGFVIRRLLEAASRTVPLIILLFVPIFLGRGELYRWIRQPETGPHKAMFLSVPFFLARTGVYFLLWLILAFFLNKFSRRQDLGDDPALTHRMRLFSAPALIIYCLTVTAASFDWVMSLTPDWYSTIFGMIFLVGQALTALSFCTAALMLLSRYQPLASCVKPADFHDLGNLLLTFVILWAYMAFSQYLIIWAGNGKEEITWYADRLASLSWRIIGLLLIIFHFAVPFCLLLSRQIKRRSHAIGLVALAILIMRWLDLIWLVEPAAGTHTFVPHWIDLAMPLCLGGFWLAFFIHQLRSRPLLPLHAPEGDVEAHHD